MKTILCGICLILCLTNNNWALEENTITVDELVRTSSSWDGRDLPEYPKGKPEVTILKITIPPHIQLPIHKHPVINAGVLLKGKLTVVTEENETLYLKAGDAIAEVVDKWHHGRNEGDEPAEIIVFYAGIKDMPITVKKDN